MSQHGTEAKNINAAPQGLPERSQAATETEMRLPITALPVCDRAELNNEYK